MLKPEIGTIQPHHPEQRDEAGAEDADADAARSVSIRLLQASPPNYTFQIAFSRLHNFRDFSRY